MKNRVSALLALVVAFGALNAFPAPARGASCFQDFLVQADLCTDLENWWSRSACFLDAELTLAGCIRRTI
ncbi:MAG TPA: hypothetical protein VNC59_02880 [Thermoanaerobaculia bacterium]|nr:hypothetical protein [Thermoanaerobaculia bacterium]